MREIMFVPGPFAEVASVYVTIDVRQASVLTATPV
jgi:hypothetical protein